MGLVSVAVTELREERSGPHAAACSQGVPGGALGSRSSKLQPTCPSAAASLVMASTSGPACRPW